MFDPIQLLFTPSSCLPTTTQIAKKKINVAYIGSEHNSSRVHQICNYMVYGLLMQETHICRGDGGGCLTMNRHKLRRQARRKMMMEENCNWNVNHNVQKKCNICHDCYIIIFIFKIDKCVLVSRVKIRKSDRPSFGTNTLGCDNSQYGHILFTTQSLQTISHLIHNPVW